MPRLSPEMIQACRANPLAAHAAKRFPFILSVVIILNVLLVAVTLTSLFWMLGTDPAQLDPAVASNAHLVTFVSLTAACAMALLLGFELVWMHRNNISPKHFPDDEEKPLYNLEDYIAEEVVDSHTAELTAMMSELIYRLRGYGAEQSRESSAGGHNYLQKKEYHRSLEVLVLACADSLEANRRALEDKIELGFAGSGTGFRQLELTHKLQNQLGRISAAASRAVHSPKRKPTKKNLHKTQD